IIFVAVGIWGGSLRKLLQPLKTIGAVESLWTAFEKRKVFLTEARLFIRRSRMRRKMEYVALECWRRTILLSEFGDRLNDHLQESRQLQRITSNL
ncbi:hypothetical protein, partial [Salmonella enterica]|uniref:hypothetical protein n=1 Tax=Salmonella enterica TaxID=28901 RepID=UPI001C391CCB